MAKLIHRNGAVTIPSTRQPYFHALVRTIISQQLSVKAAETIGKRVLEKCGGRYFNAERLLNIKALVLRECGLSKNKIRYVHSLANAVVGGELNFRKLTKMDNETISNTLMMYPGIGKWSADIFLITSLQRMDVFPIGDLIIKKSIKYYYCLSDNASLDDYHSIAKKWHPYQTIASLYLWKNKN